MPSQHWRGALKSVVPPLLPALVALLLSPRRCALPLWRCAWSSLVPQHSSVRGTYEKALWHGLSNLRRIASERGLPSQERGKPRISSKRPRLPRLSPHRVVRVAARTLSRIQSLQGVKFCTAWVVRSADRQGTAPRIAEPPTLEAAELIPRLAEANAQICF